MTLSSALAGRRSIRKYDSSRCVTQQQVQEIIDSAILAPSWKNSQTARYYCAVTPDAIAKVRACLPEFNQKNSDGAALIVATFESNRSGFDTDGNPNNECGNGWGYYDLGLHNENLVLAAHAMGLGTLIMGIRDSEAIRQAFSIPDSQTIVSVIAVGYPAISPDMPKRKTTEDIITWID